MQPKLMASNFSSNQDKLKGYEDIKYTPSRDRQWHLYTVIDKPFIRRMFLRTLVRQPISEFTGVELSALETQKPISFTSRSILRSLTTAMEELELNAHSASLKPDHAHMYLYIVREQQIYDLVPYHRYLLLCASFFCLLLVISTPYS